MLALAAPSPPLRLLHSADWQIGKPYARVSDPDKRARLRQVRLEAIDRIGNHVKQQAAQVVVVAGDLFDSPTPSSSDVSAVCAAIGAIPCPVLVIPGNHDHGAPGTVWHSPFFLGEQQRRAPNLQLLLERSVLELDEVVVLPCPLLRRTDSSDPCDWLNQIDWSQLNQNKPRLVLAHGSVQGFGAADLDADDDNPASGNNRLRLEERWLQEVDYVALGDWHGMKRVSSKVWYSGTPEPDRFPRHNDYQSGVVLQVDLRRGAAPQAQPLATGCLGWHPLAFALEHDADLERLERQLTTLLEGRIGQDLLLLEISGSLSLAGQQAYQELLERLEAQLLRLKQRGQCSVAPASDELSALTQRPGDPLIAQVATTLQSLDSAEALQALAALYRAVQATDSSPAPPTSAAPPAGPAATIPGGRP